MRKAPMIAIIVVVGLLLLGAQLPVFAQQSALAGTSWVVSSLNGQLPLPGTTITMVIGADGTITGSDGCNRYTLNYTVDGSIDHIRAGRRHQHDDGLPRGRLRPG